MCCPSPEGSPYNKARQTKVKRSHELIAVAFAVLVGILVLAVGYYQSSKLGEQGSGNLGTLDSRAELGVQLRFTVI